MGFTEDQAYTGDRNMSTSSALHRSKPVAENHVTSVLSKNEVPIFDRELTADEATLAALGYKYAISITTRDDQST